MRAIIHALLLSALRDRMLIGMVVGLIAISYLSYILGATALTEAAETAITLAGSTMRILVMLGLIVFTCFYIRQMIQNRELAVQMARPISRNRLLIAYFIGFRFIALCFLLPCFIILALMQPQSWSGYAAFCISLAAETAIITAFSMFAAFSLHSAAIAVLAATGFYLLGRLMGFFITTILNRPVFTDYVTQQLASGAVDIVALITPRLDFFGNTAWLHYGATIENWLLFLGQTIIFTPLLLLATALDIRRKDF